MFDRDGARQPRTRRSGQGVSRGWTGAPAREEAGAEWSAGQTGHRADAAEVDVTTLDEGDPLDVHADQGGTGTRENNGASSIWTPVAGVVRTFAGALVRPTRNSID